MQLFVDSLQAKLARGENLSLEEAELLHLREQIAIVREEAEQDREEWRKSLKVVRDAQEEILTMFKKGDGAIWLIKTTIIVGGFVGMLYGAWKVLTGDNP